MMTYRWIILAIAATMLGGAAWFFGRPELPKTPPAETNPILASSGLPEPPKELPPKMIEVIDLASAYEPIREPQSPSGINPASFFEDAKAPSRIPYAVDEDNLYRDVLIEVRESQTGLFMVGGGLSVTQIDIKPREVVPVAPMPRVVSERLRVLPREVK